MANGITYSPEDEHAVMLINQVQRLCQTSMMVPIKAADKKADKANSRLDGFEEKTDKRLSRLDDEETGKVTAMWNDREAFTKMVRNFLMVGALVSAIVAGAVAIVGVRLLPAAGASIISEQGMKDLVRETVRQMNGEAGP